MNALTNVPTTWHIHILILSAEASTDSDLENMFEGRAAKIRADLKSMKAAGLEVISSAGCDNRDAKGYCQGHPVEGDAS